MVFVGRPGSGKTTLARLAAAELKAAHLRIDAIETAIIRSGVATPPLGPVGYAVAHTVGSACLRAGADVVVDAVTPGPDARAAWCTLAASEDVPLRFVEVVVSDPAEHRRRVEERESDLVGLVVPTWTQVTALHYEPWNVERDGPRLLVRNDGPPAESMRRVLPYLSPR